jgi:hypothetical protein
MWMELRFQVSAAAEARLWGGAPRTARVFRKTLAAISTKHAIGLPPLFFGYTDDAQADPSGDCVIGMGWTPAGLRIVATGQTACSLLAEKAGAIHAALMIEAQHILPLHSASGEHGATFLPYARPFFIQSLAVGSTVKDNFWFRAAQAVDSGSSWLHEADSKIALAISRSLMRQAFMLLDGGDEVEGNVAPLLAKSMLGAVPWSETGCAFGNKLSVKLHRVGGQTYVPAGGAGHRLCLRDVEFTMQAQLGGPWFAGRLKNQAAGQVMASTRPWAAAAGVAA